VAEADQLVQSGNTAAAERLYVSAIGRISDIQRSHTYLLESARQAAAAQAAGQDSSAALSRLQTELERSRAVLSQQARELSQARSSLDQRTRELSQAQATINRQNQQIAGYEASQAEIAALRQEVSTLRRRYSSLSSSGASARVSQSKVLDLVDTKLQVREVLSSAPVRSQYPELYDAMEDYFDTFATVQLQSGQEEALRDANAVLDDLLGSESADLASMKRSYAGAQGDPFAQFLQKLEALLE
jgi:chromosome segregation ATPase